MMNHLGSNRPKSSQRVADHLFQGPWMLLQFEARGGHSEVVMPYAKWLVVEVEHFRVQDLEF